MAFLLNGGKPYKQLFGGMHSLIAGNPVMTLERNTDPTKQPNLTSAVPMNIGNIKKFLISFLSMFGKTGDAEEKLNNAEINEILAKIEEAVKSGSLVSDSNKLPVLKRTVIAFNEAFGTKFAEPKHANEMDKYVGIFKSVIDNFNKIIDLNIYDGSVDNSYINSIIMLRDKSTSGLKVLEQLDALYASRDDERSKSVKSIIKFTSNILNDFNAILVGSNGPVNFLINYSKTNPKGMEALKDTSIVDVYSELGITVQTLANIVFLHDVMHDSMNRLKDVVTGISVDVNNEESIVKAKAKLLVDIDNMKAEFTKTSGDLTSDPNNPIKLEMIYQMFDALTASFQSSDDLNKTKQNLLTIMDQLAVTEKISGGNTVTKYDIERDNNTIVIREIFKKFCSDYSTSMLDIFTSIVKIIDDLIEKNIEIDSEFIELAGFITEFSKSIDIEDLWSLLNIYKRDSAKQRAKTIKDNLVRMNSIITKIKNNETYSIIRSHLDEINTKFDKIDLLFDNADKLLSKISLTLTVTAKLNETITTESHITTTFKKIDYMLENFNIKLHFAIKTATFKRGLLLSSKMMKRNEIEYNKSTTDLIVREVTASNGKIQKLIDASRVDDEKKVYTIMADVYKTYYYTLQGVDSLIYNAVEHISTNPHIITDVYYILSNLTMRKSTAKISGGTNETLPEIDRPQDRQERLGAEAVYNDNQLVAFTIINSALTLKFVQTLNIVDSEKILIESGCIHKDFNPLSHQLIEIAYVDKQLKDMSVNEILVNIAKRLSAADFESSNFNYPSFDSAVSKLVPTHNKGTISLIIKDFIDDTRRNDDIATHIKYLDFYWSYGINQSLVSIFEFYTLGDYEFILFQNLKPVNFAKLQLVLCQLNKIGKIIETKYIGMYVILYNIIYREHTLTALNEDVQLPNIITYLNSRKSSNSLSIVDLFGRLHLSIHLYMTDKINPMIFDIRQSEPFNAFSFFYACISDILKMSSEDNIAIYKRKLDELTKSKSMNSSQLMIMICLMKYFGDIYEDTVAASIENNVDNLYEEYVKHATGSLYHFKLYAILITFITLCKSLDNTKKTLNIILQLQSKGNLSALQLDVFTGNTVNDKVYNTYYMALVNIFAGKNDCDKRLKLVERFIKFNNDVDLNRIKLIVHDVLPSVASTVSELKIDQGTSTVDAGVDAGVIAGVVADVVASIDADVVASVDAFVPDNTPPSTDAITPPDDDSDSDNYSGFLVFTQDSEFKDSTESNLDKAKRVVFTLGSTITSALSNMKSRVVTSLLPADTKEQYARVDTKLMEISKDAADLHQGFIDFIKDSVDTDDADVKKFIAGFKEQYQKIINKIVSVEKDMINAKKAVEAELAKSIKELNDTKAANTKIQERLIGNLQTLNTNLSKSIKAITNKKDAETIFRDITNGMDSIVRTVRKHVELHGSDQNKLDFNTAASTLMAHITQVGQEVTAILDVNSTDVAGFKKDISTLHDAVAVYASELAKLRKLCIKWSDMYVVAPAITLPTNDEILKYVVDESKVYYPSVLYDLVRQITDLNINKSISGGKIVQNVIPMNKFRINMAKLIKYDKLRVTDTGMANAITSRVDSIVLALYGVIQSSIVYMSELRAPNSLEIEPRIYTKPFHPPKLIMGGNAIIPDAAELYVRIPLLAELYIRLLCVKGDTLTVENKLSIIINRNNSFGIIMSLMYTRLYDIKPESNNIYLDDQTFKEIISEINKLYTENKNVNQIIDNFIDDISSRITIIRSTDIDNFKIVEQKELTPKKLKIDNDADIFMDYGNDKWEPSSNMYITDKLSSDTDTLFKPDLVMITIIINEFNSLINTEIMKHDVSDPTKMIDIVKHIRDLKAELKLITNPTDQFILLKTVVNSNIFDDSIDIYGKLFVDEYILTPISVLNKIKVILDHVFNPLDFIKTDGSGATDINKTAREYIIELINLASTPNRLINLEFRNGIVEVDFNNLKAAINELFIRLNSTVTIVKQIPICKKYYLDSQADTFIIALSKYLVDGFINDLFPVEKILSISNFNSVLSTYPMDHDISTNIVYGINSTAVTIAKSDIKLINGDSKLDYNWLNIKDVTNNLSSEFNLLVLRLLGVVRTDEEKYIKSFINILSSSVSEMLTADYIYNNADFDVDAFKTDYIGTLNKGASTYLNERSQYYMNIYTTYGVSIIPGDGTTPKKIDDSKLVDADVINLYSILPVTMSYKQNTPLSPPAANRSQTAVLSPIILLLLKTFITRKNDSTISSEYHLLNDISELKPYHIENLNLMLPYIEKSFISIQQKCRNYILLINSKNDVGIVNVNIRIMLEKMILISSACIEGIKTILNQIGQNSEYFETEYKFIQSTQSINNTTDIPFMPVSHLTFMYNMEFKPYNSPELNNYDKKYLYGIKYLLTNYAQSDITSLSKLRGAQFILSKFNTYTNIKLEESTYIETLQYMIPLFRFVLDYTTNHNLSMGTFKDLYPINTLPTHTQQIVCELEYIINGSNGLDIRFDKVLNNFYKTSKKAVIDKVKTRILIQNLIDLNTFPIKIAGMQKELPLIYYITYKGIGTTINNRKLALRGLAIESLDVADDLSEYLINDIRVSLSNAFMSTDTKLYKGLNWLAPITDTITNPLLDHEDRNLDTIRKYK